MAKHRPERMCISCGKRQAKSELFRFACDHDGNIRPDVQQKLGGRGAYLCFNDRCLENAVRRRKFGRAFQKKSDDSEDVLGGIRWLKPEFMKLPKNLARQIKYFWKN